MSRLLIFTLLLLLAIGDVNAQSNYALQGIDVEYTGQGLPQHATLDGKVTELDTLQPQISLNRTSAVLNCAQGSMAVMLRFNEPFYGIAYADFDRSSPCSVHGSGSLTSTLEFPLRGCGTRQDPQRVFTNNVIVRFHPGLEMEGDEVITIVCRYPPPIVPLPPAPLFLPPNVPGPLPAPLKEFEVLLIICAILFLGLMLLGLGCSYYCLKQRNIQVIRKRPFSPEEEKDRDTLSSIESFSNLKIPRVQAPPSTGSSSEVPLEDTIASDYPSSIEEGPQRPGTVSSEYSDTHPHIETEIIPPAVVRKPQFDVALRVAQQPELMNFSEQEGSISSFDTGVHAATTTIPDLHPPPRQSQPPVFIKPHAPLRSLQTTELVDNQTIVDRVDTDRETRHFLPPPIVAKKPEVSVHEIDDVYLKTIVEKRLIEDEERTTRETTQYYKRDNPKWDVVISQRGPPVDEDNWDRGSETTDVASSVGWSAVEEPIRPHYTVLERDYISRKTDVRRDDVETTTVTRAMQKLQQDDTQVWQKRWSVLLRVLESPPMDEPRPNMPTEDYNDYDSETTSILTDDDRERWRQIITTESTLRNLLTQATVREDYERISRDTRYEKLFEPEKWEVIIKVLSPPEDTPDDRFYSDSSEVSSSVSSAVFPRPPRRHMIRKKSSTSATSTDMKSMTDVRSMTEVMVTDYTHDHPDDNSSLVSSLPGRSIADRSMNEIVEFAPLDEDDDDFGPNFGSSFGPAGPNFNNDNYTTHENESRLLRDSDNNIIGEERVQRTTFSSSSSRLNRY